MWDIGKVTPYDRNPRQNDGGVEAVAKSLREFGWRQPVVVDSAGVVVVGHTRLKAARSLGMTEIPVHVAAELTPEQARAYRIADNQTSNLSAWDQELLRLEAVDLDALGFDLDLLGFGPKELAEVLNLGMNIEPGSIDDQSRLDQKSPTICPECGHKWVP